MKKIILTVLLSAIQVISCDIDGFIGREEAEEAAVKKPTLTILNLPENTAGENLTQISVQGGIAAGDTEGSAVEGTTATVPLLSPDGERFTGTGIYLVQIIIIEKPDKTLLELSDVPVEFTDGYGTLDISRIAEEEPLPIGLTILNLPENTVVDSFKSALIGNTARCADYQAIEVDGLSALVPLQLNNGNGEFTKTGIFFITLILDVDSLTHFEITAKDKVAVEFVDGRGTLDLDNYGNVFFLPRSLTILNMPENVVRDSFQSVDIGGVAKAILDDIKIEGTTATVPVTLNSGKEFTKTGTFYITLRVIIDSLNDIEITKADFVICVFENGKGTLDLNNLYGHLGKGYIEGDITNRNNYSQAQVIKGTKFEMNGYFYHVISQAPMDNLDEVSILANTIVYIYAVESESNVMNYRYVAVMRDAEAFIRFRLSTVKPVYDAERRGYYNGDDRALWKFLKMGTEWRYKTDAADAFEIENQVLSYSVGNLLYRWENVDISPTKVWLEPGIYCFEVAGASGGDSASYRKKVSSAYSKEFDTKGGDGGKIIELVSLDSRKQVSIYTGRTGATSPLNFVEIGSYIIYGAGRETLGSGVSGGGGGAGSFISYDLGKPGDYILIAGGGAGALGATFYNGIYNGFVSLSGGGDGGGVDKGGDSGGIPQVTVDGYYWENVQDLGGGDTYVSKGYTITGYRITDTINKALGGGITGIGNKSFGEIERIDDVVITGNALYKVFTVKSGVKELLTDYLSTLTMGGKAVVLNYDYAKTYKAEDFKGGAGGNNRNATRGGNAGNGYVRIYSLN
jgi:hypothetical protein